MDHSMQGVRLTDVQMLAHERNQQRRDDLKTKAAREAYCIKVARHIARDS